MEFVKVSNLKISDEIVEQIKLQIVNGNIQPGDKLPSTRELSELFEVGRSTVREALSALKAIGLVDVRQGEGSYVRSISADEVEMPSLVSLLMNRDTILELLEARKALEVSNAALAAQKRTDADLQAFQVILDDMQLNLGDEAKGEKADILFHLTLAKATHNSIMVRLLETISSHMELAIHETRRLQMYASKSVSRQLWQEHLAIYEAIEQQDVERSQQTMREHLLHVEHVLLKFLK